MSTITSMGIVIYHHQKHFDTALVFFGWEHPQSRILNVLKTTAGRGDLVLNM
jgi:hypothetical protein